MVNLLYIEDPLQLPTSNYELHARQWSFTSQFPTVPIALVYGKKYCSAICLPASCFDAVKLVLSMNTVIYYSLDIQLRSFNQQFFKEDNLKGTTNSSTLKVDHFFTRVH